MPVPAKLIVLVFCILLPAAHAAQSPDLLVQETTDRVLGELSSNYEAMQADADLLYAMVDSIVLPHFDFERMSKLVLGKHWKKANETQRSEFVAEFKALLVRTYATALFEYTDQKIVYKPYRRKEGSKRTVIKTEVVPADGPKIPVDYALSQGKDDAWKVYDIRIDEISMVTNYRTSYGKIIESRGMDSLISLLGQKREAMSE